MKFTQHIAFCVLLTFPMAVASKPAPAPVKHKSVYDYSLVAFDGKEVSLSTYKGKVLLIVTLASQSIYKNQLAALEDLQKTYADKGLELVGIPSGDFGSQELSDNAAVQRYYSDVAHVNFPVYSKASLRGKDTIPLIKFLTDPKDGVGGGEIHWSFTKFLIDREGKPVARFEADSEPDDAEFRVKVEQVLDGTFKKKDAGGKEGGPPPPDGDDDDGV